MKNEGKRVLEVIVYRNNLKEYIPTFAADIKDIEVDKNKLKIYLKSGDWILINNKDKIVKALTINALEDERS